MFPKVLLIFFFFMFKKKVSHAPPCCFYTAILWIFLLLQFKKNVLYFKMSFIPVVAKAKSSVAITPDFSVIRSFRFGAQKKYYYYQFWKRLCCLIFLWKPWYISFRILWWTEKKQHIFNRNLLKYYQCFPCHFWFNASLLNKSIIKK